MSEVGITGAIENLVQKILYPDGGSSGTFPVGGFTVKRAAIRKLQAASRTGIFADRVSLGLHKNPQLEAVTGAFVVYMAAMRTVFEQEIALLHARCELLEQAAAKKDAGRPKAEDVQARKDLELSVKHALAARNGESPQLDTVMSKMRFAKRLGVLAPPLPENQGDTDSEGEPMTT